MNNNRERLSTYEKCRLMVLVDRKLNYLKETIDGTTDDFLSKLLTTDVEELTEINRKLRGQ